MKSKFLVIALLIAVVIAGGLFVRKTTANNRALMQATSQASSIKISKFELLDASVLAPTARKITFTLDNSTDKDAYYVDLLLSENKTDKTGLGLYLKNERSLRAHGSVEIEQIIKNQPIITPQVRCVVFNDGSFEGDIAVARRVNNKRTEATEVAKKYFDLFANLDKAEKPLLAVAQVKQQISEDLQTIEATKPVSAFHQQQLMFRKGALIDALGALEAAEKNFIAGGERTLGAGLNAANSLSASI